MSRKQKFKFGDLVRVADDLGPSMDHFDKGCNAIVIASYAEQFGGGDTNQYTIFIENSGESSWYYENQLTFIRNDVALLETWKEHREARVRDYSDLKWIRKNWNEIRNSISPCSIIALFDLIGFTSSFSKNGEYACLYGDFCDALPFFDAVMECSNESDVKLKFPTINNDGIAAARRIIASTT